MKIGGLPEAGRRPAAGKIARPPTLAFITIRGPQAHPDRRGRPPHTTHTTRPTSKRPGYDGIVQRPSRLLILAVAFSVAIAGTFVFAFRAGRHARRLHFENEPIRSWMSVPFIAHTHHVPSAVLFQAIGIEPQQHDRRPLRVIAREQHRPVEDVVRDLERALASAGHTHPALESPGGKAP